MKISFQPSIILLFSPLYLLPAVPVLQSQEMSAAILFASLALGATLILLSAIDLEHYRLPDTLTLPLIAAGVLLAFALGWPDPIWHVAAAAVGYLSFFLIGQVYLVVRGIAGLGLGDAKLFAGAGAWVGMPGLVSVAFLASALMLLGLGLGWLAGRRPNRETRLPFGPALAFGLWIVWLYGPVV